MGPTTVKPASKTATFVPTSLGSQSNAAKPLPWERIKVAPAFRPSSSTLTRQPILVHALTLKTVAQPSIILARTIALAVLRIVTNVQMLLEFALSVFQPTL